MQTAPSRPPRLKTQLTLVFGTLVVLASLVLTWALGDMLRGRVRSDAGRTLTFMASNAAQVLAAGLHANSVTAAMLAQRESIWANGLASPEAKRVLEVIEATAPSVNLWVGLADEDGVVRASTGNRLLGASVRERPWFQRGAEGLFVGDVHPAKLLATLLPAAHYGEPQRFLDYAAPLFREGQRIGVLGVHASWSWAADVIDTVLPAEAKAAGIEIFIFNREGDVIFAPGGQSQKLADAGVRIPNFDSGVAGPALVKWHDGGEHLSAAVRLPAQEKVSDLGWTIVAREPAGRVFAAVKDATLKVLLIGIATALLGSLLAGYAAGRLGADLRRLSRAARDVEMGVPGARIPAAASSAELRTLSESLGSMTQRLVTARDDLELQVRQRTLELEQANIELGRQAQTDPLTALPNRRRFDALLERALADARHEGHAVSALMVDADHFKRINDVHGHAVGDEALKTLAAALRARLRDTDVVARYGGEEFAVLLPRTTGDRALLVANQLVADIGSRTYPVYGALTVSIGVASCERGAVAPAVLMQQADDALYRAKAEGRNRACPHDGTGSSASA